MYRNKNIKEDVGRQYLQNKFNIPNEFQDFDKSFLNQKLVNNKSTTNDIIIDRKKSRKTEGDWLLIKNPSTLDGFGYGVRGIIVTNGDFFLESSPETIHNDILFILTNKGILHELPRKNWTSKLPEESGFLTMQRFRNTNNICIGESNKLIYNEDDMEKLKPYYMEFINTAKAKCPNINFVYKLVGIKSNFGGKFNEGTNLMENIIKTEIQKFLNENNIKL